MARADEKNVVVSDESEESESSTPAEDPVLDVGVPLASSAAADAGPGPGADVRFCRKCKTNSYLRKGSLYYLHVENWDYAARGKKKDNRSPSKLKKKPEPAPSVPKPLLPKPLKRSEGQIPAAFRARPMQLPTYQLVQPPAININIFAGSSAAGSSDAIAGLMPLLSSLVGGGGRGAPLGSGVGPVITEVPHGLEDRPDEEDPEEEEKKKDDMEEDGKGGGPGDKKRKRDDALE
ncbi:unnamed protein product [Symbiodinium sp. KB8]|nr:unnamed protein product [Symbiodinium sp. KB8]